MTTLPTIAKTKLTALDQSIADGTALAAVSLGKAELLEQRTRELFQQIDTRPQEAEDIIAEIAQIEGEAVEARDLLTQRQEAVGNDRQLRAQIDSWMQRLPPGAELVAVDPPKLKPMSRDAVAVGIDDSWEKIASLKAELRKLRHQPLPRSELMTSARAFVDKLAALAEPRLAGAYGDGEFSLTLGPDGRGPLILAAWLDPEGLLEKIEALFPPEQGKAGRAGIDAIEQELVATERREEALIGRALEQGQDVQRRAKASPLAVLGIKIAAVKAKAKEAA